MKLKRYMAGKFGAYLHDRGDYVQLVDVEAAIKDAVEARDAVWIDIVKKAIAADTALKIADAIDRKLQTK